MKKVKIPLKSKKREMILILVIVIVVALFFSGYSMGKEYSDTKIQTNAKIAEPILVVENNPVIEVNGKKEKEYYNFKVKNYKENGEITQIDLQYNIEIITEIEESISFKLYKGEQEISLANNKTENVKLTKDKIQEDEYRLEIIYDKNKSNSTKDILQEVQIKVHSEQLKS